MAFFQKKPAVSDSAPAYTVGAQKTRLIVGLGNPGPQYDDTRHNAGQRAVDWFATNNDFPAWVAKRDLHCALTQAVMGSCRVILCKPLTFMNSSGKAISAVQRYYRIYNPDTLVIYDELAVKFGNIRCRRGGSDAGHNGVKSLIEHIGEDFNRIRIGIGSDKAGEDPAKFVLSRFSKEEKEHLDKLWQETGSLITEFIYGETLPHDTRTIL